MNESLWIAKCKGKDYKKLDKNIKSDIVVIGGGIVGITVAYLLNKKGKSVVIVDADKIGEGCSGRNTGKVSIQHNIIYSKLKESHDIETAQTYYEENKKAFQLMENIIEENKIKCDFENIPSYVFTEKEEFISDIKEEEDVCKTLGVECEYFENLNIPFKVKGALCFKNQAQFNPKKYLDELASIINRSGIEIYENTPIIDLEKGKVCKLKTKEGYIIEANKVIISTHSPWYDDMGLYFVKQKAERSYLIAGEYYNEKLPKGIYVNVEEPRKTFRIYEKYNERFLIIGGQNHKVGQGEDDKHYYEEIETLAKKHFSLQNFNYRWSAQDYVTPDKIPYIGYLAIDNENIYVATGFSKWGMTNGTAAANIISNMISGTIEDNKEIFSPFRKGLVTFSLLKENINVFKEYLKGKIALGDKKFPENLGEGKVVIIDGSKYGAYIDYEDKLHLVDITCTHLGCELTFNNEDKTWDCPCHGSRFNYDGKVLEGPATNDLKNYGEGANDIDPHIL